MSEPSQATSSALVAQRKVTNRQADQANHASSASCGPGLLAKFPETRPATRHQHHLLQGVFGKFSLTRTATHHEHLLSRAFLESVHHPRQPYQQHDLSTHCFILGRTFQRRASSASCAQSLLERFKFSLIRPTAHHQHRLLPDVRAECFNRPGRPRIISIICSRGLAAIFPKPSQPRIISISCSGLFGKVYNFPPSFRKQTHQPRIISLTCSRVFWERLESFQRPGQRRITSIICSKDS